jgi:hypothetical protein
MKNTTLAYILLLLSACSCGGGSSSSGGRGNPTPNSPTQEEISGYFIDSPVEGLKYATYSGRSGQTTSTGEFKCLTNEEIKFYIGNTQIASAICRKTLPKFLLTLDKLFSETSFTSNSQSSAFSAFLLRLNNNSTTDKITIPPVVRNAIGFAVSISWSQSAAMYLDELNQILIVAGKTPFVGVPEFQNERVNSSTHLLLMEQIRNNKNLFKGLMSLDSIDESSASCLNEYFSVSINEFNQVYGFNENQLLINEASLPNVSNEDMSLNALFDFNNSKITGTILRNTCDGSFELKPIQVKNNNFYNGIVSPIGGNLFNSDNYCMENGQNIKLDLNLEKIQISGSYIDEENDESSNYQEFSINNEVSYPYIKSTFFLNGKQTIVYVNKMNDNQSVLEGALVQSTNGTINCLSLISLNKLN